MNSSTKKIAVSASDKSIKSDIDPRFGRCANFLIIDAENGKIINTRAVKNKGTAQDRGAGISAAEQIGELGAKTLITGETGPKAEEILDRLGIEVIKKQGAIEKALNEYLGGSSSPELSEKENRVLIPLLDDNGLNSKVSPHFGRAPYFGIYSAGTKEFKIVKNEINHNDPANSPADQIAAQFNPNVLCVHDIGTRAINLFKEKNILLKTGNFETAKEIIDNFGRLETVNTGCAH